MTSARCGVICRVAGWDRVGSEADSSNHPVAVVSRGVVNEGKSALVVPLTSPSDAHESWWEVALDGASLAPWCPACRPYRAAH